MNKEEKTMGRLVNELRKCHPMIQSSAVRNGRVFQYKYYLKTQKTGIKRGSKEEITGNKLGRKRESKEEEKKQIKDEEAELSQSVDLPPLIALAEGISKQLIELNDKSFNLVEAAWYKQNPERGKMSKLDIQIDYFTNLISEGKSAIARR